MEPQQPQTFSPPNPEPNSTPQPQPNLPPAPQPPMPQFTDPTVTPQPVTNPPQPVPQSVYPNYPQQPMPPMTGQPVTPQAVGDDYQKDFVVAFLLSWLLGGIGADRFYLGYTGKGIAKLLTLGGLGIWALIDTVRLAFGKLKDKEGQPLRGYEKNKKWVRILAILHIVFVGLIILGIIFSLVLVTGKGVQQKARDVERKTDISALQAALETYKLQAGYYPSLSQMNSSQFRQQNFPNLDQEAYKDPQGTTDQLAASPGFNQYEYAPAPTDCTNQGNDKCITYTLVSTLELGGYYTKYSQN